MWTEPARLLPQAMQPVAAWDSHGLYVAMRSRDEPDSEWVECSEYGDVHMSSGGGPILRDPELWTHLPLRHDRSLQSATS